MNGVDTQGQPTTGALLQPSGSGFVAGCSGTLIGCRTFLTAGHCVCPGDFTCTPDPAAFAVYLQHAGILGVSSVDVHPDYHFNVESDVAVLTLSDPTTGIPPTPINTIGTPALGATGTIAGYGITSGAQDDAGILREGQIITASCSGVAPEPAHVCWVFEAPIGPAGEDSNTCSGDSGGPLFMDLGAGEAVLAGVTSGGTSSLCLGSDVSFDANVFESRVFIQGVAGGDLGAAACGTLSQVGEPETQVTTLAASGPPDSGERKCRGEVVNQVKRYTSKRHALLRACYDRVQKAALPAPCPDPVTAAKLQQAANKVDPSKLARKCSSPALAGTRLGGACASAQNESELADCIVSSVNGGVTAMLDVQYADSPPGGAIADAAEAKCQRRIAKQLRTYAMGKISAMKSCRSRLDRGVVASCPDSKAADRIAILAGRVAPKIARDCGDAQVAALDAAGVFGGSCTGASTAAGLAACELTDHDEQVAALMGLVQEISSENRTTFEVAPGTERFRVTLNAVDPFDGSNDLDVYLKLGAPPSPTDFDLSSTNAGVFEAIESVSPASGTWHVLVETFAGVNVGFQLTATTFEP